MRIIYVNSYGARIRAESDLILIEKDGEKSYISPRKGEILIMGGGGSITAGAIKLMHECEMTFVVENHGELIAYLENPEHPYSAIVAQIEIEHDKKMQIAREMILSSAKNRQVVLRKYGISGVFSTEIESISSATDGEQLMGAEGAFTRAYFSYMRTLLDENFGFKRREKHPPPDPINSMLSYGYTILASKAMYAIKANGLSPRYGVLHATYRNKMPLVYDFMEEFRGPVVDMAVILASKKAKPTDFRVEKGFCYINEDMRKKLIEAVFERLFAEMKYYGKKMSLMDIIMYQATVLKEAIEGKSEYKGFNYA